MTKAESSEMSKHLSDFKPYCASRPELQRSSSFMEDFPEENDLSGSPKTVQDGEDNMHFHRIRSESNSPGDPFTQGSWLLSISINLIFYKSQL